MTDITTLIDNTQTANLSEENLITKPITKNILGLIFLWRLP